MTTFNAKHHYIAHAKSGVATTAMTLMPAKKNASPLEHFEAFLTSILGALGVVPVDMLLNPELAPPINTFSHAPKDIKRYLKHLKAKKVIKYTYVRGVKMVTLPEAVSTAQH